MTRLSSMIEAFEAQCLGSKIVLHVLLLLLPNGIYQQA